MGQSHLQFEVLRVLVALLVDYFSREARLYRVGGELTFLIDEKDPTRKVMPDLYVLEDEPQGGPKVPSWKPWEHEGKVPTLALEVVSDAYEKDYSPEEMPERYQELGVRELVRYDPDFSNHPRARHPRRLLSHFVRNEQGLLVEQPGTEQHLRLATYPLWLLHRPPYYLRIATGEAPERLELWPTGEERAQKEAAQARAAMDRARQEAERARQEAERAQNEAERAQKESARAERAEAEVRRLHEELARLRGDGAPRSG